MPQLGQIEPERITQEEYIKRQQQIIEQQQRIIEQNNQNNAPQTSALNLSILNYVPGAIFVLTVLFALLTKNTTILLICCAVLGLFYVFQSRNAGKLIRTGSRLMAKKSLLTSFIPFLASLNTAVYGIISSDKFQNASATLSNGLSTAKDVFTSISPQYGPYVYYGLIGIIVIGGNVIIIRSFKKVLRAMKLIGKISSLQ